MNLGNHADGLKFLIRARDTKFTAASDAVFAAADGRILKAPIRAPRANAIAERWAASARRERLDRMLITSERHLRLVLGEYAGHYNATARTGHCTRTRLRGARIHLSQARISRFCGGTGSAALSTNTPRSHDVTQFPAPTPICVRPGAGARRAASPGSPRTPHPTAAGGSARIVRRATAGRPAGSGPG